MSQVSVVSILKKAKALIRNPKRWCQGNWAQTKTGRGTNARSRYACKWCATGAVRKIAPGYFMQGDVISFLDNACRAGSIVEVNDSPGAKRAHARVMKAYDRAIKLAKKYKD